MRAILGRAVLRPHRGRQRGVAVLLAMVVMSSLLVGGIISSGVRVSNLRGTAEKLQGATAYACAEAGLAAGRDWYRARSAQWNALLQQEAATGVAPYSDYAAYGGAQKMRFEVHIYDNFDEFPHVDPTKSKMNRPLENSDSTVLLVSRCIDQALNRPIELRQYLTLDPINTGTSGLYEFYGKKKYDTTNDLSGGAPLDGNGGLQGGSTQFSSSGIKAVGVDLRNDQIQLSTQYTTLPFIWLSNSGQGTVSKINTETGVELGRYYTGPRGPGNQGWNWNPSRTSVDLDGNVWVGNRHSNTVTKIGLKEAGNCVDRNGDGVISTSTGPGDVRNWNANVNQGVAGAEDECILAHVTLSWPGVETPGDIRAVTVDKNNNVFVAGLGARGIYKLRSDGTILAAMNSNHGHYGAVADKNGDVWTMARCSWVERHNNNLTSVTRYPLPYCGYGIALDKSGRVWTSDHGYRFAVMDPANFTGWTVYNYPAPCPSTQNCAQGLAVANNGEIWISGSLNYPWVDRFSPTGVHLRRYSIPGNPTGVSFDAAGKVWTSNYNSGTASRIDPNTHQVDTFLSLSYPYNYSDMTGFVARNFTARQGTWTVRQYCGASCNYWKTIKWIVKSMPPASTISVRARSALNVIGLASATWKPVTNGQIFPENATGLPGRIIEVEIKLTTQTDGVTPIVEDPEIEPWEI